MDPQRVIHTERLTLRRLEPADIPALVAGLNDYEVSKWLSVVPFPYAEADARAFLDYLVGGPAFGGFGIHAPEGLVGVVGIDKTLGYWLARKAQGKGYMTEAARALVGHYFASTGAEAVEAGYFVGNDASRRVLAKLGFREANLMQKVKPASQDAEVDMKIMRLERSFFSVDTAPAGLNPARPLEPGGLSH